MLKSKSRLAISSHSTRRSVSFSKILCSEGQRGSHWSLINGQHVYDAFRNMLSETITAKEISSDLAEHGLKAFDTYTFRESWKKHLPNVSPVEFLHGMFGKIHCTEGNFKSISEFSFEDGKLNLQGAGCYVHGAETKHYSRVFDFNRHPKEAYHSLMEITSANQGSGAVKKLFNAIVPLYKKMGVEEIALSAGKDRGAYAWSKYGFNYPDYETQQGHMSWLKTKLANNIKDQKFDKAAQEEVDGISQLLNEPSHVAKLWHLTDIKTPALDYHFGADIIHDGDKSPSFIKHLLYETSYSGVLNFKDDVAMDRLQGYISK